MPDVEGLEEAGYLTFREAIELTRAPQSLFILGGGAVGCEFAQLFSSFGVDVTLADRNDRLLHNEDPEAGDFLRRHFERRGVTVRPGAAFTGIRLEGGKKRFFLQQDGSSDSMLVDEVLIATGKAPNVDLGLENAGIEFDPARGVTVDPTLRTTNPRVYAAGDVAGPFRFTHAASYQGGIAAANMFGPSEQPEVASMGMTEAQAREQHGDVRIGRADLFENDRALTTGEREGFVKVVAAPDGRLLGGLACIPRAGEVIHELGLAIRLGATAQQVATTIHAFPTYSEALGAACAAAG
jgi:pyruvate/2-oxoglutarate dehydrogenase complex dihydrolipoamide dehydrogenase (E3) component